MKKKRILNILICIKNYISPDISPDDDGYKIIIRPKIDDFYFENMAKGQLKILFLHSNNKEKGDGQNNQSHIAFIRRVLWVLNVSLASLAQRLPLQAAAAAALRKAAAALVERRLAQLPLHNELLLLQLGQLHICLH
jgi:hypothetical protein